MTIKNKEIVDYLCKESLRVISELASTESPHEMRLVLASEMLSIYIKGRRDAMLAIKKQEWHCTGILSSPIS